MENTKQILLSDGKTNSFNTDLNAFDRGSYLNSPESSRYQSFEDLNYQGEYAWTGKTDRQPQLYQQENVLTNLINNFFGESPKKKKSISSPKGTTQTSALNQIGQEKKKENLTSKNLISSELASDDEESNHYNNDKIDDFEDEETESLNTEDVGLKKRISEELKYSEEVPIDNNLEENFSPEFLSIDPQLNRKVEEKIKQNYYSNPIYKSLLSVDIDSFLAKQPTFQKLTKNEEKKLFEKRLILGSYYDSLRYYNQLPYTEQFQEFLMAQKVMQIVFLISNLKELLKLFEDCFQ